MILLHGILFANFNLSLDREMGKLASPMLVRGGSTAKLYQIMDQRKPKKASTRKINLGPYLTKLGKKRVPQAAPRYIPEVVRETDRDLSCGGTHCARTVCMEGKMKPWPTPIKSRERTRKVVLLGSSGVNAHVNDHMINDHRRTRRPPNLCAAHPPGIWEITYP